LALDKKVIIARLRKLDKCFSQLRKMQKITKNEYLKNIDFQDIAERNFQVAIQTCIDIGNYLIARNNLSIPDEEENVFVVLSKNKILPEKLAERIKGMVGFRNILVHEYLYIDSTLVYDLLQTQLADFTKFAQSIVKYLKI
jgi:uncharacterized protein YutE (UPF0331/DUF86 family)